MIGCIGQAKPKRAFVHETAERVRQSLSSVGVAITLFVIFRIAFLRRA